MDRVVVKSPFRGTEGMAQQLGDLSSVPRTGVKNQTWWYMLVISALGVETGVYWPDSLA